MSDHAQRVPPGEEEYRYTELFVRLPADWPLEAVLRAPEYSWPVEWLKKAASFPIQNDTWLGGTFIIISNGEPPKPLGAGTRLTCILLLCETEDLSPVRSRDGRSICLYSLVPLYTEERDLEKAQGLPALLERFLTQDVGLVVNPSRINAATGK